jgi:aspartyl-tRNA(Asn)/glutamyl-tRNA(Gln) amidotransferase subunit A
MAGIELAPLQVPPQNIVLGIPAEMREVDIAPAVCEAFDALIARLRSRGTTIRNVSVAGWKPGRLRRAGLLLAETEAGEEFGTDLDPGGAGFSDTFRALIDYGRKADPVLLAAARATLAAARTATAAALEGIDALLMPTAPQPPFLHGAPVPANPADLTALANAAGLPAIAFPLPEKGTSLPASAQIVGKGKDEIRLLAIAETVAGA